MKYLVLLSMLVTAMTANAQSQKDGKYEQTTLGAGCFWCVEGVFERVKGVVAVESGYSNGELDRKPTYREVCTGRTGFAEVARITFDPEIVSFETILEVFWHTHDPTTLNRQGADRGTQYRSAIFYHSEEQRQIAEASLKATDTSGLWRDPIVTEISPIKDYYVAEDYHQDYYNQNPNQGYCSIVIAPKIAKFKKEFAHLLRETTAP